MQLNNYNAIIPLRTMLNSICELAEETFDKHWIYLDDTRYVGITTCYLFQDKAHILTK